jgi:hypothetical protein
MPEGDGEAEWRDLLFRTRCAVRCGSSSNGQLETGEHKQNRSTRPFFGQPVQLAGKQNCEDNPLWLQDTTKNRGGSGLAKYRLPAATDSASASNLSRSNLNYLNAITPNNPFTLLFGPAVKKSWFFFPLIAVPPPNSIPQSWSIKIGLPAEFLMVPTNFPVVRLKPLMVPEFVLLEISRVLLSGPKSAGAMANPQGWFSGAP